VGLSYYMEKHYTIHPYELVYGNHVVIPIKFEVKTLRISLEVGMDLSNAQKHIL
jgi:hypothetical protein